MKKLITICVGLIVAGCATTTQLDEANAKIQDLEKRLASIENARVRSLGFGVRRLVDIAAAEQNRSEEGDKRMMEEQRKQLLSVRDELVRARESKLAAEEQKGSDGAPATNTIARTPSQPGNGAGGFISARRRREQREAENAAKEAEEKKVVDAKIDAFLKEYLGVQFGDSIDKFPESFDKEDSNTRVITMLKKFKYFDKAYGEFFDGKLYLVAFYVDIEDKYSIDSTNEKIDKSLAELAESFGLSSTAFKVYNGYVRDAPNTSYSFDRNQISGAPRQNFFSELRRQAALERGSLSMPQPEFRRYVVSIDDPGLKKRLENDKRKAEEDARRKKNAEGETLPDPE